jgi:methionyl-tRNA formyltransferase
MKILVVTDNGVMLKKFRTLLERRFPGLKPGFEFRRSYSSSLAKMYEDGIEALAEINVKSDWASMVRDYSLVFSLHCKQIFPRELIRGVRCVNIHPGYNPDNRGWYPQVFAIMSGGIVGATIHEMDEQIDAGRIIARRQVAVHSEDTSLEVYERVLEMEIELLEENLEVIVNNTYEAILPEYQGVFRTRKDFEKLCQLDLNSVVRLGDGINLLRGLTHGSYANAYFLDEDGKKIFVRIMLTKSKN